MEENGKESGRMWRKEIWEKSGEFSQQKRVEDETKERTYYERKNLFIQK